MKTEAKKSLARSRSLSTLIAIVIGGMGCSEQSDTPSLGGFGAGPGSQAGATATNAGNGPSTGTGGSGASGSGQPTIVFGGATNSTGGLGSGDEECATDTSTADLRPVSMFIQFDRSGSMMYENNGDLLAIDKWAQAVSALTAFFTDAKSDGLNVALRFFPDNEPAVGCVGSMAMVGRGGGGTPAPMTCDAMACSQPLVALGPLLAAPGDPQETALIAAIQTATPDSPQTPEGQTYTPMYPALEGALLWARGNLAARPDDRTVVVLVTDGEPSACETRIPQIAALAATAHDEAGIDTYAIGIQGSQEESMNQIAVAGGTERAYFSGDAQTAQQDLLAALNAIRGNVLSCSYDLPAGGNLDLNKVNVQFSAPDGSIKPLVQVKADNCAGGGWHYDNDQNPTSIALCDSTCQEVQATARATIEVVVGCKTRVR